MLLKFACELLPREPKGAEGYWMPSKPGQPRNFSWFCAGPSFVLLRAVSRKSLAKRGTSFAHRLTAKSATCPFPVAKHCCKWFLLTCRIYVSSLMLLNCACELLPRELKGSKPGQPQNWVRRNRFSWFCPGPSFFRLRAVSRKTASWQQARSAPKLAKKKQLQLVLHGIKQTAKRRDWETQGGKRETRPRSRRRSIWHPTAETGRHRETSGRHDPEPHLASDRRDWETQGDTRETQPGAGVTASGI